MKRCHGTVVNPDNKNFGNRCSLFAPNDAVFCEYHRKQTNDEDVFKARFKEYIAKVAETEGIYSKLHVVDDMYNFIVHNIGFVNKYDNFKNISIAKLEQFFNEGWTGATKYLNILKQTLIIS